MFLEDAVFGLRVKLSLAKVVALLDFVGLLGLPAQVVELAELCSRDFGSAERGEQNPGIVSSGVDANGPHLDRLFAIPGVSWRGNQHPVVHASTLQEYVNGFERVGLRHTDDPIDPCSNECSDNLERDVAPIENNNASRPQVLDQLQEFLALAGRPRCQGAGAWKLADHIEEHGYQHLRAVSARRSAETLVQLRTALQIVLHAVHRENAPPVPHELVTVRLVNRVSGHVDHALEQVGLQLAPRLAERSGRNRVLAGKLDANTFGFIPELIQKEPIAAPPSIAGHEQEQCHNQLGGQRTSPSEVLSALTELDPPGHRQQLPYKRNQVLIQMQGYGAIGFSQPFACQRAEKSLGLLSCFVVADLAHVIVADRLLRAPRLFQRPEVYWPKDLGHCGFALAS